MFESTWVRVRAPLIPEVALVEFPPKNPKEIIKLYSIMNGEVSDLQTLLVENKNISTSQIQGVSSAETRYYQAAD